MGMLAPAAGRFKAPEKGAAAAGQPLRSLESGQAADEFDLWAFTISWEMDYFNVIEMLRQAGDNPDAVNANAVEYLDLFGYVTYAWLWARMMVTAAQRDDDFGRAKVTVGRFYYERLLPRADRCVERPTDLLVEQRVKHRLADFVVQAERPFADVTRPVVGIEDFVKPLCLAIGATCIDDSAVLELEPDAVEHNSLVE